MAALCVAGGGCSHSPEPVKDPAPAVYYWRTVLKLDSAERQFLAWHDIRKMYVRFFDVVLRDGRPMPNATLRFDDTIPAGIEVIPTIFVMENCLRHGIDSVAPLLVNRVLQMCETCDVTGVRQVQIDCDWTATSQQSYFDFLKQVRSLLAERGIGLSVTIRLHQLRMTPPPADEGVLMVYNTGDVRRRNGRNPILDPRDVQPYLRYLSGYSLPLAAAYPVFLWQRNIYGVRVEHVVEADEILQVKAAVEKKRSALSHTILLYHLDHDNINRYNHETFESIYRH